MFMVDTGAPAHIPLTVSEKVTEILITVYWDYKIKLSGIQDHQTLLRVTSFMELHQILNIYHTTVGHH